MFWVAAGTNLLSAIPAEASLWTVSDRSTDARVRAHPA
jgi:hypothetical protein